MMGGLPADAPDLTEIGGTREDYAAAMQLSRAPAVRKRGQRCDTCGWADLDHPQQGRVWCMWLPKGGPVEMPKGKPGFAWCGHWKRRGL